MTTLRIAAAAVAALALAGCAIKQQVTPVTAASGTTMCVIQNPDTRAGFLETYRNSLAARGFAVKLLPASASTSDCPLTSTYTGIWRWDLALYMAYAEIKVYSGGKAAGEAKYDSLAGSGNLNKFIDAEKKIDELVGLLFPKGTK